MLLISVLKVFLHLRVLCLPKVKMGASPCRETGAFWCILVHFGAFWCRLWVMTWEAAEILDSRGDWGGLECEIRL